MTRRDPERGVEVESRDTRPEERQEVCKVWTRSSRNVNDKNVDVGRVEGMSEVG